jgi:hypothetical protein
MPPSDGRPRGVELLLCAHHFRVCQWNLPVAGAVVRVIPAPFGCPAEELALL